MKTARIAPPASEELAEAVRWYEVKHVGLGGEFFDAVVRAIDLVRHQPEIGAPRSDGLGHRRILVDRFPYQVVYRVRGDELYVVAVAHLSRQPGYWKRRL
jgi:toxin ParE1/3/4